MAALATDWRRRLRRPAPARWSARSIDGPLQSSRSGRHRRPALSLSRRNRQAKRKESADYHILFVRPRVRVCVGVCVCVCVCVCVSPRFLCADTVVDSRSILFLLLGGGGGDGFSLSTKTKRTTSVRLKCSAITQCFFSFETPTLGGIRPPSSRGRAANIDFFFIAARRRLVAVTTEFYLVLFFSTAK